MTARVVTLQGEDAGAYYVDGPRTYYLDGEIEHADFLAVMDGRLPATGRLLGTSHHKRTVRGFDVTCCAPKAVSTLYALGDDLVREQITAGHDAAVAAMVDWIEQHALCRYRVDGEVRIFDAEGIVAALFRQHTSRALDPQLHTHVVIPNRVCSPDGRWLALDARTLKCDQRTLSALYHAGLRAELTERLGVRWLEPEDGIAEIADADKVLLAELSSRSKAIKARTEVKLERFADTMGRQPTPRERWRLEREASVDCRPAKQKGYEPGQLRERWREQVAALGVHPGTVVGKMVHRDASRPGPGIHRDGHPGRRSPSSWSSPGPARSLRPVPAIDREVMDQALDALAERQSTWRPAEITRELAAAIPTTTGMTAAEVHIWIERLRQEIEAHELVDLTRPVPPGMPLRRDGRPITESAIDRVLTTPAILAQEARLLEIAERRDLAGGTDRPVDARGLGAAQRDAAAAVAGTRPLAIVVGPAGTGKTTAMRPGVEALCRQGRLVFGVAPSATAAEVLADDTGIVCDTVDKLLVEHRDGRRPAPRFDLPAGSTVLCDEAAMVSTPNLAELFELAERRRWRLVLVGDPLQFSAVGRSGMFAHLVQTVGAVELDRVHRFTAPWERDASLRLRAGDTDVVALYHEHGRLHGGTSRQMQRAVVNAWWTSTETGERASMMAPTREAVAALNAAAQARRLATGELDVAGRSLQVGDQLLHVGDVVASRQNDRRLRTDRDQMVKNRDRWTVEEIHDGGSLTVVGRSGQVRLPTEYVAEHVELAYAETSHANQGRTVDRSFLYLDAPTDAAGIYVALTRGRATNEAFVVLDGEESPADLVADCLCRTWEDQPAVTHLAPRQSERPASTPSGGGSIDSRRPNRLPVAGWPERRSPPIPVTPPGDDRRTPRCPVRAARSPNRRRPASPGPVAPNARFEGCAAERSLPSPSLQIKVRLDARQEVPMATAQQLTLVGTDVPDLLPDPGADYGEVFTKPWVVEFILDLVGYTPDRDLGALALVEPSCGSGAFLGPIVDRLIASANEHGRPIETLTGAVRAFDLLEANAKLARKAVVNRLEDAGLAPEAADALAREWVTTADFILHPHQPASADFVVGNPPYIRIESLTEARLREYRRTCPTMRGRADIYVGFYELGLSLLRQDGVLGFICADRWMHNQYGADLRQLVTSDHAVDTIVTMHDVDAFEHDVSAYPAVVILRNTEQGRAAVVDANGKFNERDGRDVVRWVRNGRRTSIEQKHYEATRVEGWFAGRDLWPTGSPSQLALIADLEARFPPLEDPSTGTRVGIGVATGCDEVFITRDADLVEGERLLPLLQASDTASGRVDWSGGYLVNPWNGDGLVDLGKYPRLANYLNANEGRLRSRHVAQKRPAAWYRTIDRVNADLTGRPKLVLPDMKAAAHPVLDDGTYYPHHNLYYVVSDTWDPEVLGGLLLSDVANLFVGAYCVKMRGGCYRFQAQYLRRIRVPVADEVSRRTRRELAAAFSDRDRERATAAARDCYSMSDDELPAIDAS